MVLSFLRKRSKIIEIVAARDIVFALAQSGVCAAFSRGDKCYFCRFHKPATFYLEVLILSILLDAETNQRICFLNISPDEVIRSLFYNKNNDSLITVSVYASDNFSCLKCRTTRIEYGILLCLRLLINLSNHIISPFKFQRFSIENIRG